MGTGISMSSVNKIKELAESGDYSLALDILDHQDLTKSLSPQFIRICGEVYYENKRYPEARAALVKAHAMAPVGNKIIFSLIQLYLSMGLFRLAEKYYEIYQFNQDARDAGTFRIEYLIARAKRKPIIELYSILLSANELDTDEKWDFEMLLMHAAMNNMDKLKAEGEIFRATYKSSTRLGVLDDLLQQKVDVKALLYCFPEEEILDTDPEQQEIRDYEAGILEKDELRMHPKDPKIMIMVENDEPIPNSVKFRQMLARSKERKEERREKRREKSEGEDEEKTGWFDKARLSRKEEEAIEEVLTENAEHNPDKQQLLNEILNDPEEAETESLTAEEPDTPDMVELIDESTPEDKAVYNDDVDSLSEQSFEDAIEDFDFQDEEEFETVVMVDAERIEAESVPEKAVETSDAVPEENTEAADIVPEENEETSDAVPEESSEEGEDAEFGEKAETAEGLNEFREAVLIDEAEQQPEEDADQADNQNEFNIDLAIQSLDEYKVDLDHEPEPEEAVIDQPDIKAENSDVGQEQPEAGVAEAEPDKTETGEAETEPDETETDVTETEPDETGTGEAETKPDEMGTEFEQTEDGFEETGADIDFEAEAENVDIVEVEADEFETYIKEPEADDIPQSVTEESEEIPAKEPEEPEEPEEIPMKEPEEPEEPEEIPVEEPEDPEESEEIPAEEPEESEESEEIPAEEPEEPEESEEIPAEEPEESEESEEIPAEEPEKPEEQLYRRNIDFPVFKTSLFPDYNRDEPPVIDHESKPKVEIDEKKIHENLKKEEDLLNETDRLLARLGIELGTDYKPGISVFHDEEDDLPYQPIAKERKDYGEDKSKNKDSGFSLKKN